MRFLKCTGLFEIFFRKTHQFPVHQLVCETTELDVDWGGQNEKTFRTMLPFQGKDIFNFSHARLLIFYY